MVPGDSTRPVGDRVKESLFNIIGLDIHESVFLDLFAGTGSVGIEALSRGAASAVFVDNNRQAVLTISKNLEIAELTDSAVVLQRDAFVLIKQGIGRSVDYVYIAPPQYKELWVRALKAVDRSTDLLHPDAWIIVQIHPREYEEVELENLVYFDERKYGNTLLLFYQYPGD